MPGFLVWKGEEELVCDDFYVSLLRSDLLVLAFGEGACLPYGDRLAELLLAFEYFFGVFVFYFFS